MATGSAITSLAILKVNWDTLQRDYIENFVPFVVECIRTAPDDVVSLPLLQEALRGQFGLFLPLNPLKQILQRAAKHQYLTRSQGVFRRDMARCTEPNFAEVQQRVTRVHDNVVGSLRAFARTNHDVEWSAGETEAALLSFIAENGLAFLYAEAERSPLVLAPSPKGSSFVVGAFLSHVRQDSHVLEDIELLIKGNILANALFLPDPGRLLQRFEKTRVYLDTTFIMFAAGYAGKDRQAPCTELLSLLHAYGADLYCFQATYEETRGILDACTSRLKQGNLRHSYGPTIEYFIQEGFSASDLELMSARLPQKILSLGIRIDSKPSYDREFQIDEQQFETRLQNKIGYKNPKALVHDVDCVSSIARIRRGQDFYQVETCRALFVTTNVNLARVSREFFQNESSPGAVSLCITDYALGNILWLKNPTKAPDLPRKRLVADAYAAMQPSDSLWRLYLVEIAKLEQVSPEDYLLLRHSTTAKAALMDITFGEAAAFSDGTVAEILAIAKENLRADLQASLTTETGKRLSAELRIDQLESDRSGTANRVVAIASRAAWVISRAVFVVAVVVLGLATLYTFPWSLPDIRAAWWRYSLAGAQSLLFVYTIASVAWGTSLHGLAVAFEQWLVERFSRRLRKLLRVDSSDSQKADELRN